MVAGSRTRDQIPKFPDPFPKSLTLPYCIEICFNTICQTCYQFVNSDHQSFQPSPVFCFRTLVAIDTPPLEHGYLNKIKFYLLLKKIVGSVKTKI